jgi:hypothetical protein
MNAARLCIVGLLAVLPAQACAHESYYVIVFGAQRPILNLPDHTHTWGTFIRVFDDPRRPGILFVEPHTVSWSPASLLVRSMSVLPEPGVNLELHRTFQWAREEGLRVSMWGPYQIDRSLFELARAKRIQLEGGQVRYKPADVGYDSSSVSNCVHALADVVEGPRLRLSEAGWGESATYSVVQRFRPFFINPQQTHDWLLAPLGLIHYPVVRRDLDNHRMPTVAVRGVPNGR